MESSGNQVLLSNGGRGKPDIPVPRKIRPTEPRTDLVTNQAETRIVCVRNELVQEPPERCIGVAVGGEQFVLRTEREWVGTRQHHRVTPDEVAQQPDDLIGSLEDARGDGRHQAGVALGQ